MTDHHDFRSPGLGAQLIQILAEQFSKPDRFRHLFEVENSSIAIVNRSRRPICAKRLRNDFFVARPIEFPDVLSQVETNEVADSLAKGLVTLFGLGAVVVEAMNEKIDPG